MSNFPSYFIPKGVPRPDHLPVGLAASALRPGHKGPGGVDTDGGLIIGAGHIGQPGWKETKAGWWVLLEGVSPSTLRKTYCHSGEVVSRIYPDGSNDIWIIPQLLTIQPDGQPGYAILERRDYSWRPPIALEHLMDRLRAAMVGECDTTDDEAVSLVAEILKVNYWISQHELELSGWLTPEVTSEILQAASGVTAAKRELAGKCDG